MIELKHITTFPHEIIATDEVGRGPLSGPVVIGAVRILIENADALKGLIKFLRPKGVRDSKTLTAEDRQCVLSKLGVEVGEFRSVKLVLLKGIEVSYVTWEMDHTVIDQENILAASLRGMKEASLELSKLKNSETTVFIDGNKSFRWSKDAPTWKEVPIIKGDSKSVLIGLASIIAKEKRDDYMRKMHELYPQYGFATHMGYPTESHREAIKLHGPSPIHRKTFKGVAEFLGA